MVDFSNLKSGAFGLDISDFSIKIAKLVKKKKGLDLVSFGNFPIEAKIMESGEIKDPKELAKIIKASLNQVRGEKLKTDKVVVSLPEEKAFLKVISMPLMGEEELAGAIRFEAENHVPIPVEQVYLDFEVIKPLSSRQDHLNILINACPRETVDAYLAVVKQAGLNPQALEIESQATARALIKNQLAPVPVLVIDLGADSTSLAIFADCSLKFTSSLFIGGQIFTKAVMNNFKVGIEEAERIKRKYGLIKKIKGLVEDNLEKEVKSGAIFDCFIPALTDLVEQIKKHLIYYQTYATGRRRSSNKEGIEKILLCGGSAVLKGLDNFLASQLKIPVELGNPWVNILPEKTQTVPPISFEESLRYTTALGLALRGVKGNN